MEQTLPPDVEQLIEQLKSPDPIERMRSVQGFAKLDCRDESVRLALEKAAWSDPEVDVRSEARYALGKLGFPVRAPAGWVPPELAGTILPEAGAQDTATEENVRQAWTGTEVEKATFWQRWAAYFLDGIVTGLASLVVSCLGQVVAAVPVLAVVLGALAMLLPVIYFAWAYSTTGQTVGKRMMGIKVIAADGMPLSWTQGVLRSLGYLISGFLFSLGFLWAAWDDDKQAWHDKIAGTYVVKAAYEYEPVPGTVRSIEESRRQKRWLLGIGISMLLLAITCVGLSVFSIQKSVAEVQAMGPWPAPTVEPEYLVDLDLSAFVLEPNKVMDARHQPWSKDLSFQKGSYREYDRARVPIVAIWALRYSDRQAANGDYAAIEAWAKENCGSYQTAYITQMGIIHCGYSDYFSKVFWNDRWIVVIDAAAGTDYVPVILVDMVRDAMAAHWR